jgi:hypothetical protein
VIVTCYYNLFWTEHLSVKNIVFEYLFSIKCYKRLLNCLKLLDTDGRPEGKFSSSGRMLLTDERPDEIPRRPDGCQGTGINP